MSNPLKVLITRPRQQGEELVQRLHALGFRTSLIPMLEILPLNLELPVQLEPIIIFVSANAVRCGLDQLGIEGLREGRVLAIGPVTAAALNEAGLSAEFADIGFRTEELVAKLKIEKIIGQAVTLVCGEGGRGLLQDELREMNFEVNRLEVYRRVPLEEASFQLKKLENGVLPDVISLMNLESLVLLHRHITSLDAARWMGIPVVVSSSRIEKKAKDLGFLQVFCQTDPTESSLVGFLTQFSK